MGRKKFKLELTAREMNFFGIGLLSIIHDGNILQRDVEGFRKKILNDLTEEELNILREDHAKLVKEKEVKS